jgi:hypothetical protein
MVHLGSAMDRANRTADRTADVVLAPACDFDLKPRGVAGARFAGLALVLAMLQGCAIQPWVKPYERERLSDPIMQFSRAPLADKHREHIHAVREGARGATGVQGGGCGCN